MARAIEQIIPAAVLSDPREKAEGRALAAPWPVENDWCKLKPMNLSEVSPCPIIFTSVFVVILTTEG